MHPEFWHGNLFVNIHLEDREGDGSNINVDLRDLGCVDGK